MTESTETVSLLAYEIEAARATRTIRRIAIGWTASVVIFAAAIVAVILN